ncbi:MAG TPA: hypothetical protein VEN28_06555 [Burkholderiaceae bacterium]|nr:hypothetical protein [Burkholderiaceae bacterium]
MSTTHLDIAQVRLDNALLLFDEFVQQAARTPDAATLRGLEGRFAERLQIQPSYWSQIKGRSRQIGERLARQFEQLCGKPNGWMDVPHGVGAAAARAGEMPFASGAAAPADAPLPQSEDERFIVGLVLSYYRRHPDRARTRLLELLGEALLPTAEAAPNADTNSRKGGAAKSVAAADAELWRRVRENVAPLKRKR